MAGKGGATSKKPRPKLNVACTIDQDVPAVFYCSKCHKPFCEDCIGEESARRTLCLHCASVEDSIEEAEQLASGPPTGKKGRLVPITLAVIACAGILVSAYILFDNNLETERSDVHIPAISPQLQGIAETRADLEALVAQAAVYRKLMGHPPASLDELKPMLGSKYRTEDPVSHEPYIIESDDAGNIMAVCPTPRVHGVASIAAVAGKPAQVTYLDQGTS